MKLLFTHADYIRYKTKRKSKSEFIEDVGGKEEYVKEALIVFVTVEKGDEYKEKTAEKEAVKNILEVVGQVKPGSVVLFPFAHFARELAAEKASFEILRNIEKLLIGKGLIVHRLPFGWYKEWELRCKGAIHCRFSQDQYRHLTLPYGTPCKYCISRVQGRSPHPSPLYQPGL